MAHPAPTWTTAAGDLPDLRSWRRPAVRPLAGPEEAAAVVDARRPSVVSTTSSDGAPAESPDAVARGRARRRAYRSSRTLGSGASGTVRAAVNRETGAAVAIKVTRRGGPVDDWGRSGGTSGTAEEAGRRFDALASLEHPNVLSVVEFFETRRAFYLVMELADGGDLQDYARRRGTLEEDDIRGVLRCILRGLAYLHAHGIVHRDVKPSNVLLRRRDDPRSAALADFDGSFFSRDDAGGTPPNMRTLVGTPSYMAPEVALGRPYGAEVDVYSTGCIAFHLACGRTPFQDAGSFEELYQRISAGVWRFPEGAKVPAALGDLVGRMLETDPAKRISVAEALDHPFLAESRRKLSGVEVMYDEGTGELVAYCRREEPSAWSERGEAGVVESAV